MARCQDCNVEVSPWDGNMCILPNSIWLSIADTYDLLCDCCIEKRLQRELTPDDFPNTLSEVYRDQKLNCRDIPCNNMFFEQRGWNL